MVKTFLEFKRFSAYFGFSRNLFSIGLHISRGYISIDLAFFWLSLEW